MCSFHWTKIKFTGTCDDIALCWFPCVPLSLSPLTAIFVFRAAWRAGPRTTPRPAFGASQNMSQFVLLQPATPPRPCSRLPKGFRMFALLNQFILYATGKWHMYVGHCVFPVGTFWWLSWHLEQHSSSLLWLTGSEMALPSNLPHVFGNCPKLTALQVLGPIFGPQTYQLLS